MLDEMSSNMAKNGRMEEEIIDSTFFHLPSTHYFLMNQSIQ
jgi:hypothetical protein